MFYRRVSEHSNALLSVGRGIGKPGRREDPRLLTRPLVADAPDVRNMPFVGAPRTIARPMGPMLGQRRRTRAWVIPQMYAPRGYGS